MTLRKLVKRPMHQPRTEAMRAGTYTATECEEEGRRCHGIGWIGLVLVTK